jgi:hypothetical protein
MVACSSTSEAIFIDISRQQERGAGVSEVVETDIRKTRVLEEPLEASLVGGRRLYGAKKS